VQHWFVTRFDVGPVIFENRRPHWFEPDRESLSNMQPGTLDLTDPATYDHWTRVTIRFGDEDRMGHVNNASYAVWFEASRVAYLESLYESHEGLDIVLARLTVNYLQETTWPGEVQIGARLSSVGNKSMTSVYAVFRDGVCLATCECVNVFFDTTKRVSRLPSDEVRAGLQAELERLRG